MSVPNSQRLITLEDVSTILVPYRPPLKVWVTSWARIAGFSLAISLFFADVMNILPVFGGVYVVNWFCATVYVWRASRRHAVAIITPEVTFLRQIVRDPEGRVLLERASKLRRILARYESMNWNSRIIREDCDDLIHRCQASLANQEAVKRARKVFSGTGVVDRDRQRALHILLREVSREANTLFIEQRHYFNRRKPAR